jgi:hypothetical protein
MIHQSGSELAVSIVLPNDQAHYRFPSEIAGEAVLAEVVYPDFADSHDHIAPGQPEFEHHFVFPGNQDPVGGGDLKSARVVFSIPLGKAAAEYFFNSALNRPSPTLAW